MRFFSSILLGITVSSFGIPMLACLILGIKQPLQTLKRKTVHSIARVFNSAVEAGIDQAAAPEVQEQQR